MRTNHLIVVMLFSLFWGLNAAEARLCYNKDDFGLTGTFSIPANPNAESISGDVMLVDARGRRTRAPWVDSGFTTLGVSYDRDNPQFARSILKIYVDGGWGPWGGDLNAVEQCQVESCVPRVDSQCLAGGVKLRINRDIIPCLIGQNQSKTHGNPGFVGLGLYGLIALENANGDYSNPNDPAFAASLPPSLFRTFHIYQTKAGADGRRYFELDLTKTCELEGGCIEDKNARNMNLVKRGRLFFQIQDTDYSNNTGKYEVTVISGVFKPEGFIERTIRYFKNALALVVQNLYIAITQDLNFISIVQAMLLLYVVLTGLLFMMGMLKMHQSELVVRCVKIGIVATVISNDSWLFFNTFLFPFFTEGAQSIADMVVKAAFMYGHDPNSPIYFLPDGANALSIFDYMIEVIIAPALHSKIISLLFFDWRLFFIPVIYICFYFLIIAIIRSISLYITSIMLLAVLIVIAPIFIVMILYQFTNDLFNQWLKLMTSSGMQIIVVSATLALFMSLFNRQIYDLLYFKVCWEVVRSISFGLLGTLEIWFWNPQSYDDVINSVSTLNVFSLLIVCMLFDSFMQQVPQLIDALATSALQPISQLYGGASRKFFAEGGVYDKATFIPNAARGSISRGEEDKKTLMRSSGTLRKAVETYEEHVQSKFDSMANFASGDDKINKHRNG